MLISRNGIELIKRFEGCKLTAYKCPAGVLTIGYGHTGDDVTEGLTISQEDANDLLFDDVLCFENGVNNLVKGLDLSQGMFDALVCFAYNVGLTNLKKSTLLKLLKDGKVLEASEEFVKWNKSNGKVLDGLTKRRAAEADLFLS